MICCIDTCDRLIGPKGARGFCPMHYKRWKAGADLHAPVVIRQRAVGLICKVHDCQKPTKAKGLCDKHYMRWLVRGDTSIVLTSWSRRQSKVERIWEFVDRNGPIPVSPWRPVPGNCWIWLGYLDKGGYGWLSAVPAHRRVYELEVGPIPDGLTIDHLCRVHACVRPDHLEAVTRAENARRGPNKLKTRCPAGHSYDEMNTYYQPDGGRRCRECARLRRHRVTLTAAQHAIADDWVTAEAVLHLGRNA